MKAQKNRNLLFALLIPVLILVYVFSGGSVGISLDFGEEALTVSAEQYDWSVPYEQIAALELTQLPDVGTLQEGIDNEKLQCGSWANEIWGQYTLCIDPRIQQCLVVELQDGTYFILNYENAESTQQLYNMFTDLLANK